MSLLRFELVYGDPSAFLVVTSPLTSDLFGQAQISPSHAICDRKLSRRGCEDGIRGLEVVIVEFLTARCVLVEKGQNADSELIRICDERSEERGEDRSDK